jgi:hypothetical protein
MGKGENVISLLITIAVIYYIADYITKEVEKP